MIHVDDDLAVKAQSGDSVALEKVWTKSRPIRRRAARSVWGDARHDWENESFFVLLHALNNYKPNLGHFDSFLSLYLKSYKWRFRPYEVVRSPVRRKSATFCPIEDVPPEFFSFTPEFDDPLILDKVPRIINSLDARKQEVLVRYFGLKGSQPQTLRQIAQALPGKTLSFERVRQIIEEALTELQQKILESPRRKSV